MRTIIPKFEAVEMVKMIVKNVPMTKSGDEAAPESRFPGARTVVRQECLNSNWRRNDTLVVRLCIGRIGSGGWLGQGAEKTVHSPLRWGEGLLQTNQRGCFVTWKQKNAAGFLRSALF